MVFGKRLVFVVMWKKIFVDILIILLTLPLNYVK